MIKEIMDQDFLNSTYIYLFTEIAKIRSKVKILNWYYQGFEKICEELKLKNEFKTAQNTLLQYQEQGLKFCSFFSKDYPPQLRELNSFPLLIYYEGNIYNFQDIQFNISIVGTRNPSVISKEITEELILNLKNKKTKIISGLAFGIDSISHETALANGFDTAAVLGSGLLNSTNHNHKLRSRIQSAPNSLVISEFEPKQNPDNWTFPLRNRIIAALSYKTIIIEAGAKSGALITAKEAQKLSREIICLNKTGERFAGNQTLIQNGIANGFSNPITLQIEDSKPNQLKLLEESEPNPILRLLLGGRRSFDYIVSQLSIDPQKLSKELSMLELQGLVKRGPGAVYEISA